MSERTEIPTPPEVKFEEKGTLEKHVGNLKRWSAYESEHLAVHHQLLQQLNSCQLGTEDFSKILFAVKLSGIKSRYCENNITALQDKIIPELPLAIDKQGKKGMPDFNILTKFLSEKEESPNPIQ